MVTKKRNFLVAMAALLAALVAGCGIGFDWKTDSGAPSEPDAGLDESSEEAPPPVRRIRAGWIPYWDKEYGMEELSFYAEWPDDVVSFAVLFSAENDGLLVLEESDETTRQLREIVSEPTALFLSFTNDLQQPDGSFSQKDAELLWRLLGADESMGRHLRQIVELAVGYNVDGIEIDYESIGKDGALWERFCLFITRLYEACTEEGLRLRVVLGWNSVDFADFPAGPEYVVMCYNLYGKHSGPGPKANTLFLENTFNKNKSLPGNVSIAFANGGFDWVDGVMLRSLTQREIAALLDDRNIQAKRDCDSQGLFFTYEDDEGGLHEIWYSDGATLDYWIQLAEKHGYHSFSLWRFGGCLEEDLSQLFFRSVQ